MHDEDREDDREGMQSCFCHGAEGREEVRLGGAVTNIESKRTTSKK